MPLGFLLALSALRSGRSRFRGADRRSLVGGGRWRCTMESLQSYLPARVPSRVDLVAGRHWRAAVGAGGRRAC